MKSKESFCNNFNLKKPTGNNRWGERSTLIMKDMWKQRQKLTNRKFYQSPSPQAN